MDDQEIRARILESLYNLKRAGEELLTQPDQYAKLTGAPQEQVNFDMQYLIDKGLVKGQTPGSLGSTKKYVFITDITAAGVEAVEGRNRERYAVKFNVININAPVTGSQIAGGDVQSQVQTTQNASGGGVAIQGDQNKVEIKSQQEVQQEPYEPGEIGRIRFGKWLMMRLYKNLSHDLTPFALIAVVFTIAFVGPVAAGLYYGFLSILTGNAVGLILLAADLVLAGLFWSAYEYGRATTCPDCGDHFTWIKTSSKLVAARKLSDGERRNWLESYKCTNCGKVKEGVLRSETLPPPSS
jgi:hypothetical protein